MGARLNSILYKAILPLLGVAFIVLFEITAQGLLFFPVGAVLLLALAAAGYKVFMLAIKTPVTVKNTLSAAVRVSGSVPAKVRVGQNSVNAASVVYEDYYQDFADVC